MWSQKVKNHYFRTFEQLIRKGLGDSSITWSAFPEKVKRPGPGDTASKMVEPSLDPDHSEPEPVWLIWFYGEWVIADV